jgi:hypothetical protein
MKAPALVAGAALVALVLAGCGGDNSSSSSAASSATTAAASASGSNASTTTPSFTGNGSAAFCAFAKDLQSSDIGNSLNGDSTNVKDDLAKVRDAMNQAKDKAPDEIKADVATVAEAFQKYDDLLAKYGYDPQKLTDAAQKDPQVLAQATAVLSDPKYEAASDRVSAYAEQVCGLKDDTSTTG